LAFDKLMSGDALKLRWLPLILVILFAVWLRARNLVTFIEWPDEIWSVWHVRGSLGDAIARTPADWPPLFGVMTWGWQQLAGTSLEAARWMMVLFAALATALIARATHSLAFMMGWPAPHYAGYAAALTFASMGYTLFAGVDVRAYGMMLAAGALTFWLTLRWLRRPDWRRSLPLALTLAWLFYSSYTSVFYIGFLTLFVLILKPRLFLRWAGVGLATLVLTLPNLLTFLQNSGQRFAVVVDPPPPFVEAMLQAWADFGGSDWFLLILGVAVLLLVWQGRKKDWRLPLLLLLWIAAPAVPYVVTNNAWFLKPRYLWWVALGLALVISMAWSQRAAWRAALIALVLLPLAPVDFFTYRMYETSSPPFRHVFGWLAEHFRPGDKLIIDPNCTCGVDIAWDYFVPQYFPTGDLAIVETPGDAARVWYLSTPGWPRDEALLASIQQGRTASIFAGPWYFQVQLHERAPLQTGIGFGGRVRLHGAEIEGQRTTVGESDMLTVRLWWSAAEKLDADYSFSLALIDEHGNITAQADGPTRAPNTPEATSAWLSGEVYADTRQLVIPEGLMLEDAGPHRLVVTVYQWWDGVRLPPEENELYPIVDGNYLQLEQIEVVAF
jgi:hypothetical protein